MRPLRTLLAIWTLATLSNPASAAGEILFIEDFVLAQDRSKAVEQLVPGTDQYYYFQCLHLQNNQQYDAVDSLLEQWRTRHGENHGENSLLREIRNRQMLLTYPQSPQQTLDYLIQRLNPTLHHRRDQLENESRLPSTLAEDLIRRDTLTEQALRKHHGLEGFEDHALPELQAANLNPTRRRELLSRLQRPEHPELVALIIADLDYKGSRGFGSLDIHRQLLVEQLDACLERKPALLNQAELVHVYLRKLQPSPDVDWRHDAEEFEAYLSRMWDFAKRLNATHNSLKAHLLYHWLALDESRGVYNKQRFIDYLALPRPLTYVAPKILESVEARRYPVDLAMDAQGLTGLRPIGDDESLVRRYLLHFFQEETTYQAYEPYIREEYLRHLFAEAKITNGLGDPQHWYSQLPPEKYQAIKDRVDLDFVPTNPQVFASDDPVQLDLYVKNVKKLIVKVYEVNAQNYYRHHGREVNTDIQLDGLIPNQEATHNYNEPPVRRIRRHFEFPDLRKPGVYVIDFIGNGKSSRIVVRKGRLQHLVKTTAAGHVFTVLNDKLKKVNGATLWMAGRQYEAKEDGTIVVPFSTNPGRQPVVLSHAGFSSLQFFQHQAEGYQLTAAVHVPREALLDREEATALIRPELRLAGVPVSLRLLEDVRLTIQATDLDGVESKTVVPDIELREDRDTPVDFLVPSRLSSLEFTLTATVKNVSKNDELTLTDSHRHAVNQIDTTEKIEDLHLSRVGDHYLLQLLGKTGEAKAFRPVEVVLQHRDFRDPVRANLATDADGLIILGALADITQVSATSPGGSSKAWPLREDRRTRTQTIHARHSDALRIPHMADTNGSTAGDVSLIEMRGGTFAYDRSNRITVDDTFLELGQLPAGDYSLKFKRSAPAIHIRVTQGEVENGFALGKVRRLELPPLAPLQLSHVTKDDKVLRVHVENASKLTRVHVFASRFYPAFDPYQAFSQIRQIEPLLLRTSATTSFYVEGRNLGDELRYILDRAYADKYPGNMLDRPTLLLNAWPVRTTETSAQTAARGTDFEPSPEAAPESMQRGADADSSPEGLTDFASLDFLAEPAAVLANLTPDEEGHITIPLEKLGPRQHVHIVAVDPITTVSRSVALPEVKMPFRDLRLKQGLDPDRHYTQQQEITVLGTGEKFELADITTGRFDTYDSLARIYELFSTLSGNETLRQFRFILDWPTLSTDEKQEKYSEFACHELNFFLFKKDPQFFKDVVRPYLENKQHKTFLDYWFTDADLADYVRPWHYAQLNVVERLLLAQRLEGEKTRTRRFIEDQFSLMPPDIAQKQLWFETAIQGRSLDRDDALGIVSELSQARREELAESMDEDANGLRRGRLGGYGGYGGAAGYGGYGAGYGAGQGAQQERPPAAQLSAPAEGEAAERRKAPGADAAKDKKVATDFFSYSLDDRARSRKLYVKLDKTKEWAENNYYRLPIEQQNSDLVTVNAFWHDYAQHEKDEPFFSVNWPQASRNFSEMMLALSLLDLPFETEDHKTKFTDRHMRLTAAGPMVVFHEQIREVTSDDADSPVLITQNFFRDGDRFQMVNGERRDKFVTDEFLIHTVYGCQVVVTNPSSTQRRMKLLVQIPHLSLPTRGNKATNTVQLDLPPYHTKTVEYFFYFPRPGEYDHFPVHIAQNETLLGFAPPVTIEVVAEPGQVDQQSWEYVSQQGSDAEVLTFLRNHNVLELDLERMAFRLSDEGFFEEAITLLSERHVYNHALWGYSLKHNHRSAIASYLQHSPDFLATCGLALESDLIVIDPVVRKDYQHLDYRPLVNARSHRLGPRRQILNDRFFEQYHRLLKVLSYHRQLSDEDRLAMTYYLLLQDRIAEALEMFAAVQPSGIKTQLQYDYLAAYLDCYRDEPAQARAISTDYASYPVKKWREAFVSIIAMLDEIEGRDVLVIDPDDRTQMQTAAAAEEPNIDLRVEDQAVRIDYQNIGTAAVNYYLIDLELLFSSNPFVQKFSGQFSHIRPHRSQTVTLPPDQNHHVVALPEALRNRNVLIEIVAGGVTRSQAYFSNSLTVQLAENYGQVKVTDTASGRPLPKTYVKVYAEMKDGQIRFYKDGYTDLRGRFDYSSLSTNELDFVNRFSLLVLDEQRGGLVREAQVPKR